MSHTNSPSLVTLESMHTALWYNAWTTKKFSRFLHGDILEVGCGIGNFTSELASYGNVWAFDIEKPYITATKKNNPGKNIHVGLGNIEKGTYFFGKKTFDTVVSLNVLEHIQNDTRAMQHIYSLTKPGGFFIVLVPIHQQLYGAIDNAIDHYRRYNPKKLKQQLTSVGFTIISSRILNFLGALGWFISGKILKRSAISERQIQAFNSLAPYILPIEEYLEPPFGTSILIIAQKPKKTRAFAQKVNGKK